MLRAKPFAAERNHLWHARTMDDPLAFDNERMVHLDRGTYHWVSVKRFRITADHQAPELLAALVHHPQYRDNYAGSGPDDQSSPNLHGPYLLDRIHSDTFTRIAPSAAQDLLRQWATRACGTVSSAVQSDLDHWVYSTLPGSTVFELPNMRPDAEHDWGWVVGAINGFHELVTVNQSSRVLTLIVASDD